MRGKERNLNWMGTRQSIVTLSPPPCANAGDGAAREAPWPNMTSCRSECSCISFPSESLTVPPPGATSARGILHDSFCAQAERKNNARRRDHKGSKRCAIKYADCAEHAARSGHSCGIHVTWETSSAAWVTRLVTCKDVRSRAPPLRGFHTHTEHPHMFRELDFVSTLAGTWTVPESGITDCVQSRIGANCT